MSWRAKSSLCRQHSRPQCLRFGNDLSPLHAQKSARSRLLPTTVQFSIVYARNSSRDSQAKLIVRSVVKWREFRGNKKIAKTVICYARLTQCSKPVKDRKKLVFKIYSSRFLDGFERLSAEATFRTPAHTVKM